MIKIIIQKNMEVVQMCAPEFIYKYMSFDKFISVIESKKLYLTRIDHWDDVFEGYLLSHYFREYGWLSFLSHRDRKLVNKNLLECIYAQSWTWDSVESDAMWRIYSPDKKGVRIKCCREGIYNDMQNSINRREETYKIDAFEVDYERYISVNSSETVDDILRSISNDKLVQYALQFKRRAFKHEAEYRFSSLHENNIKNLCAYVKAIYNGNAYDLKLIDCDDVLKYDFELSNVREILLDPHSPKEHWETFDLYCKNRKLENYGIKYEQSKLYSLN